MTALKKIAFSKKAGGKGRFWLTVMGTALSTAMLLAVFLGSEASLDVMRRYTICQQGEWFWSALQLPSTAAQNLEENAIQDETFGTYGGKYTATDSDGTALTLYGTDGAFFEMMQTQLVEGRWPQAPNEVIVKQQNTDWKVGDTVKITDSSGTVQTVSVVGLYGKSVLDLQLPSTDGSVTAFYGIDWSNAKGEDSYRFFSMPKVYTDVYADKIQQNSSLLTESAPQSYTLYNNSLITYSGYAISGGQNLVQIGVFLLRILLVLVIAIASVFLITNSFSIRLAQQKKELALLISVGATMRQAGSCLLYEALLIGAIGIPMGLLLGYGGLFVGFRALASLTQSAGAMLGGDLSFHLKFSIIWILLTAGLSALVLLFSAARPMKGFKKESVVGNLFGNGEVMISHKVTRKGQLAAKLFGIECGLAVKEAKRNWRSYKSAVRSLAVCMVIFIGAAGLSVYLPSAYFSAQDIPSGVVTVNYAVSSKNLSQTELYQKLLKPQTTVENVTVDETEYFDAQGIAADSYTDQCRSIMDMLNTAQDGNQYSTMIEFDIVPDQVFEKMTHSAVIPSGQIGCIFKNRMFYENQSILQTNLKASDYLETSLRGMPVSLYIAHVDTKQLVENRVGDVSRLSVLIKQTDAETMFQQWQNINGQSYPRTVTFSYQTKLPAELENELEQYSYNNLFTEGTSDYLVVSDNSTQLMILGIVRMLISLICYGFSGMLALISICHMITTISTELTLQHKDLAILQSVGMKEQGMKRMILMQAATYVVNALKWALPIGFAVLAGEYYLLRRIAGFDFVLPWWAFVGIVLMALAVMVLVVIPPIRSLRKGSITHNIRMNE